MSPGLIAAVVVPSALVVALVLAWFLWWQPRRRRRPLLEAVALLARDDPAEFSQIEKLLTEALTSGLRKPDVADARFALAYVRARLERYAEAEAVLTDLEASGPMDREAAYLNLWVKCRQKKYEDVERLYEAHATLLGDFLQAKLIVGIAFLHLARRHWSRKEVDGALHYFSELRRLNVLTDQIPQHLEDHRMAFAIMALFEKNLDEARKHFESARTAAEEAKRPTYPAELGLLLCRWRASERPDVDSALAALLPSVQKAYAATHESTDSKQDKTPPEKTTTLDEMTVLLRNCRLWHAVSLLLVWLGRPVQGKLSREEMSELTGRLKLVKDLDAQMGDPWLIAGLIAYYFSGENEAARKRAAECLDKATKLDVNVPEVLLLLEREKKLAQLCREGLKLFILLTKEWLKNPGVPEHLREELKRRLGQYARYKELGDVALVSGLEDSEPSLADMQMRVRMLHKRIQDIVRPRLAGAKDQEAGNRVKGLITDLTKKTDTLKRDAQQLEATEHQLILFTGEFLLKEEPEEDSAESGDGVAAVVPPPGKPAK